MQVSKYQIDDKEKNKKKIICYLLREFFKLVWCTGSGGGISIKEEENRLWVALSGVQSKSKVF